MLIFCFLKGIGRRARGGVRFRTLRQVFFVRNRGGRPAALRAAGRAREADAEEGRARQLWEDKGATLLAGGEPPHAVEPAAAAQGERVLRRVEANVAASAPNRSTGAVHATVYRRPFATT